MMRISTRVQSWLASLVGIPFLTPDPPNGRAADWKREDPDRQVDRDHMVQTQIIGRGVRDEAVLAAMYQVPRHRFIPEAYGDSAYKDHPIPIGEGQTISQPYIVAYMTQAFTLHKTDRILEIGTGTGYQAAVLAHLVSHVYTIEIVESLGLRAKDNFQALGYANIDVRIGDGYQGWPEQAPFDAIILTAAPTHIPPALLSQMKIGGRLILPMGSFSQELILVHRTIRGYQQKQLLPVSFVPMTGKAKTQGAYDSP